METSSGIKIPRLKGSRDWDLWRLRMEAFLTDKGYYDAMVPSTEPISAEQLTQRREKSIKAAALIRLALEDGPLL